MPWVKGQSGNPKGPGPEARRRHRIIVGVERMAEGAMDDIVKGIVIEARGAPALLPGEDPQWPQGRPARRPNLTAAGILLGRVWPERKGRPTPINIREMKDTSDLPGIMLDILNEVSNGNLTTEEAKAIAEILELQRKAIETADINERLKKLEANVATKQDE